MYINALTAETKIHGKENKQNRCKAHHTEHRESLTPNLDAEHSQRQEETSTVCAVDLNAINQRKRDREQREKRMSGHKVEIQRSDDSRKLYMRNYMPKRRENECFRLHDNLKAVNRMRKIRSTEEGTKTDTIKCPLIEFKHMLRKE